jgi:TonB family protein
MMDPLLVALVTLSAQLLVIVAGAAVAEALGGVADPRLRLPYWRGVALACLALPLSGFAAPAATGRGAMFLVASVEGAGSAPVWDVLPAGGGAVWWLLGVGALARLGWLCAGAVRLRQLRRRSRSAVLTPDLEEIRSDVAPRAELRISCEVKQPAGFGLWHPVVLLPQGFFAMDPPARRTVLCHELLHVARRDWPWILAEEVARALFWFHPAVWVLIERIQESREQLVDRLVIARIPSKRAYMTALLEFADGGPVATAATPLLRRRHLRSRLQRLAQESVMSRMRLVLTAVVLVCVMGAAIAATMAALPLVWPIGDGAAHAQEVVDGKGPGVTMPRVVSEVKPQYTPEAMRERIEGTVIMAAVIRTDGAPTDIEITRSLDAEYGLDNQAVTALSQWRFEPGRKDGAPVAVRVTVEMRFTLRK